VAEAFMQHDGDNSCGNCFAHISFNGSVATYHAVIPQLMIMKLLSPEKYKSVQKVQALA
jgi:hypothetical protein